MKKTKKMIAGGFYVFQGKCTASSNFIETEKDGFGFLSQANRYLKNYLTIYDYVISKDGWTLQIKLKSRKTIKKYYLLDCKRKSKKPNKKFLKKIWRIISEQMRKFLSVYVKVSNKQKSRTGSLVHSRYERFYYESVKEAKEFVKSIRKRILNQSQKLKKYRGRKKYFKIKGKVLKRSIFLSSKGLRDGIIREKIGLKCVRYLDFHKLIVSVWVKRTFNTHKT